MRWAAEWKAPIRDFADGRLKVLQGRLGEDVEHFVHQGMAELLESVFCGVDSGVVEQQGLGLEAAHGASYGREGCKLHWEKSLFGVGCGAHRLVDRLAPTAGGPHKGFERSVPCGGRRAVARSQQARGVRALLDRTDPLPLYSLPHPWRRGLGVQGLR